MDVSLYKVGGGGVDVIVGMWLCVVVWRLGGGVVATFVMSFGWWCD